MAILPPSKPKTKQKKMNNAELLRTRQRELIKMKSNRKAGKKVDTGTYKRQISVINKLRGKMGLKKGKPTYKAPTYHLKTKTRYKPRNVSRYKVLNRV